MSDTKPTIVFLSTYPPRECGLATFTQDLLHASQNFTPAYAPTKSGADQ